MPRVHVSLPDELYRELKERKLPASQLLQEAVHAELRRLHLSEEVDRYIATLETRVKPPSPEQQAKAEAIARRIARRRHACVEYARSAGSGGRRRV